MIAEEVRAHISATLAATAAAEGVRILYAAESGSRHPDRLLLSDYLTGRTEALLP